MTEPICPPDPSLADENGSAPIAAQLLSLLTTDQHTSAAFAGADTAADYDGHVALALDAGASLDIVPLHDALTSSSQLFDVPALDHAEAPSDGSAA